MWKWFREKQSEGVKAVWRFSKGQGNQFILLRERNTSYGIRVATKIEMSQSPTFHPKAKVSQPHFVAKHMLLTPHL